MRLKLKQSRLTPLAEPRASNDSGPALISRLGSQITITPSNMSKHVLYLEKVLLLRASVAERYRTRPLRPSRLELQILHLVGIVI